MHIKNDKIVVSHDFAFFPMISTGFNVDDSFSCIEMIRFSMLQLNDARACSELFTAAPGTRILKVRKPWYYAGLSYPRVSAPRITPETFTKVETHGKTAYRVAFTFSLKYYQKLPTIKPHKLWSSDYIYT